MAIRRKYLISTKTFLYFSHKSVRCKKRTQRLFDVSSRNRMYVGPIHVFKCRPGWVLGLPTICTWKWMSMGRVYMFKCCEKWKLWMLNYAHENGCTLDKDTCRIAAKNGNLDYIGIFLLIFLTQLNAWKTKIIDVFFQNLKRKINKQEIVIFSNFYFN